MSKLFAGMLSDIADLETSPDGVAFTLRLDVATTILRHLDERNWTQDKLATAAGMKSSQLSRIIHAKQNLSLDTIGRIYFSLGLYEPELIPRRVEPAIPADWACGFQETIYAQTIQSSAGEALIATTRKVVGASVRCGSVDKTDLG